MWLIILVVLAALSVIWWEYGEDDTWPRLNPPWLRENPLHTPKMTLFDYDWELFFSTLFFLFVVGAMFYGLIRWDKWLPLLLHLSERWR